MYINQTICVIFCIARTLIIISFYKWDMVINQINKKRFAYYHKMLYIYRQKSKAHFVLAYYVYIQQHQLLIG